MSFSWWPLSACYNYVPQLVGPQIRCFDYQTTWKIFLYATRPYLTPTRATAYLIPVQLGQLALAVQLQGYWDVAVLANCAVQQTGFALVQLLLKLEVL